MTGPYLEEHHKGTVPRQEEALSVRAVAPPRCVPVRTSAVPLNIRLAMDTWKPSVGFLFCCCTIVERFGGTLTHYLEVREVLSRIFLLHGSEGLDVEIPEVQIS